MRVAMLAPIAWRTPPRHYGPWERVTSLLTEELVRMGVDVTLFATGDSETSARLCSVCERGYEEDKGIDPKVWGSLHISGCFESASDFDIIHNQFDFLPLSYSGLVDTPLVTTIHGFSSEQILPVYRKYDSSSYYVSISNSDRAPSLTYEATVYHGIDLENFRFYERPGPEGYLLYFSRIHPDKGAREAIEIARLSGRRLVMAGIVQDKEYFRRYIEPGIESGEVEYLGSIGADQRSKVLGQASALLHPVSFDEPFGLSVVESMACGTPVIAFRRGSMPEIIREGETGFIVSDVGEAADRVNAVESLDRGVCRRDVQTRFSKERMAREYLEVYNRIVHSHRKG